MSLFHRERSEQASAGKRSRRAAFLAGTLAALGLLLPVLARAEADISPYGVGGYFRIMSQPDWQGGGGRLGYSDLYGRLMNEGPYAALEMRYDMVRHDVHSSTPWATVHAKIEGGSVADADINQGYLNQYRLSQLYVVAGNVALNNVQWQLGTLDYYFGDLGLYDTKPSEIFYDTVGLSASYRTPAFDILVGVGDAGYGIRGNNYDTIYSGGGLARLRIGTHLELGGGGQAYYEPSVLGNTNAPYATPGLGGANYINYIMQTEALNYYLNEAPPNQTFTQDPKFVPQPRSSTSWKAVGYLGFGKLGPIQWNSFYVNYVKLHPQNFYTESLPTVNGVPEITLPSGAPTTYTLYTHDITDKRYQINVGDEIHFTVIHDLLDGAWGFLYGDDWDGDNHIAPTQWVAIYESTVLRLQLYLTPSIHLLVENAIAHEHSPNGNQYQDHADSLGQNENGAPCSTLPSATNPFGWKPGDPPCLQYGDDANRDTWQGKFGFVLNPGGYGIFNRPSIRVLYGLQWSTQNLAFGNNFSTIANQQNFLFPPGKEEHLHQMLGLEAEAWF